MSEDNQRQPLSEAELEKLKELTTLASQFKMAADARFKDPEIRPRMIAALKPGEMEELQDILAEFVSSGGLSGLDCADEGLTRLSLKMADITAEMAERVLDQDVLADYLPEGLQNEDAVQQLKDNDAQNLAALCEHKLSM